MSRVSEDREFLKSCLANNIKLEKNMKKNNNEFSYINAFLKYQPEYEEINYKQKIRKLSTMNILYSVYNSFKLIDKIFVKKLEQIKAELMSRSDLFISVVHFIEDTEIIYDDLYFWHPGLLYNDFIALIIDIIPDIVTTYKKYLVEQYILNRKPQTRILQIFKSRLNKNLLDFNVIKKDIDIFQVYQDVSNDVFYNEKSLGVKKNKTSCKKPFLSLHNKFVQKQYRIVTAFYWGANEEEEICDDVYKLLGYVEKRKNYTSDIILEIYPQLSFLDVDINGRNFVIPLYILNDLFTKNNRSKEFWVTNKIVNTRWEFIE